MNPEQWREELAKAERGDTSGYFCRVEAGIYTIGSAEDGPDALDDEKPQHQVTFDAPFWIARYPVTNDQWQLWVNEGGGVEAFYIGNADLNQRNQPVVAVTWHMCHKFCTWLSAQLGIELRLPSEFEWEAAARGEDARRYPWGQEWIDDRAATGEDQEMRGSQYSVPVGCYPAGAAACGALDMSGNVWEWTASMWRRYLVHGKVLADKSRRVLRGGGWDGSRNSVRCGVRGRDDPVGRVFLFGFRVVVALRSH